MKHARISNGRIVEFILPREGLSLDGMFHADFIATLVEVPDKAEIGWVEIGGRWQEPADAPQAAAPRLSFLEFMDLFTDAEQLAIAGAAMTEVPTKLWYDRAVGAQFIDLGDARLAAGLQAMVDAGLITASRCDRVLTGLRP